VPILLYAAEAFNWTNKMTASIENAYSLAFMKFFKTYNKTIVTSCQFFMNKLPMNMEIGVRRLNFLSKILKCRVHWGNLVAWGIWQVFWFQVPCGFTLAPIRLLKSVSD